MSDKTLKEAVMRELEWDPSVEAAHIGVIAKDGAVTLTGKVPTYSQKWAAVRAAERVFGVRAVADELEVKLSSLNTRDDQDIAEQIARTFEWSTTVPDTVEAEVRKGWVTLKGDVDWSYQRDEAERAIRHITGVTGVSNLIVVKPKVKPKPTDVEKRIEEAITREADLDARRIWVTTHNGTAELHGTVHSFWEKRLAEQAAASAPGVAKVENLLAVTP
jgi:Predicted periplasmic or secreted lipoprotein